MKYLSNFRKAAIPKIYGKAKSESLPNGWSLLRGASYFNGGHAVTLQRGDVICDATPQRISTMLSI